MRIGLIAVGILGAFGVIEGCGGASGGVATGGTTTGGGGGSQTGLQGNSASIAATFSVDVNSGKVTIASQKGALGGVSRSKPSLFTGNSIGFTSSLLTNDALGDLGVRSMQVTLTNNSDLTIGANSLGNQSGLNVIFSAPSNTTGITNQSANTTVSTFAGTTSGYSDGATSVSKFASPYGVACTSGGTVYVADFGNDRIRKISGGYVSTLAGSGVAAETDGPATKAAFSGPYSLAINPVDGSIIVADFTGNKIRRVTTAGVVNTVAGTGVAGTANGAGNVATFTNPTGVVVDSNGNIYVSEATSNHIRKITLSGSPTSSANYTVSAWAGNGTGGLVDGPGASAEFFRPYSMATDTSGNLYVADYDNNAIRMIDPSANVTTIAGTGTESDLDGYGNTATFNHPTGITYLNGALFVSEITGEKIREVIPIPGAGATASSWAVETLAGSSSGYSNGPGNIAEFAAPYAITASASSTLYVADVSNEAIRRVNPSTGSFPIGTPTGSTNSSDAVQLSNPTGYVDDSDFGAAPYITYSGTLAPGASSTPQAWNFTIPSGVTSFQFQVMVETATTQLLPLQAAMNTGSVNVDVRRYAGQFNTSGIANGTFANALFNEEGTVATDGNGVVYFCDLSYGQIRRIDPSGTVSLIAGNGSQGDANGTGNLASFYGPYGIAVNSAGTEIFVADARGDLIRRIALNGSDPTNPVNWNVSTIAGEFEMTGFADGAGSTATLNAPAGISEGPGGELYFAEYNGNRIRRMDFIGGDRSQAGDWEVVTIAGDNTQTNGASGLINGFGTSARFDTPLKTACDGAGNVYVADATNNVIRKISPSYLVSTFAGSGGQGDEDGASNSAEFSFPRSVTVDSAGYVYVADFGNNVIRRISPSGYVETVAGGVPGTVDGLGSVAEFTGPTSVAISPSGNLYLTGYAEDDIRLIQTVQNQASASARKK